MGYKFLFFLSIFLVAFNGHVCSHSDSGYYSKARVSKPAPDFSSTAVFNGEMKEISLASYRGKYLVFFFYPLDFTFVCPTELLAFSDRVSEFAALGAEVLGVSVDSPFTHLAWLTTPRAEGGLRNADGTSLRFPLVADLNRRVSIDYGVYDDQLGHTTRGLFIIDRKGILRQVTINDLPVGRSVDEVLRLIQGFQYADEHGEVCPAGWKPGDKTIKPDPKEKLVYFSEAARLAEQQQGRLQGTGDKSDL